MKKIFFILKERWKYNNKISLITYFKEISNIYLADNVTIHSNCSLEASKGYLQIDKNVILNRYVYIKANKGKVVVGEGTEINNFTNIDGYGEVEIGKNVLIGPSVNIISYQHNYKNKNQLIKSQGSVKSKITIGDDVWIGANSIIMAGITIGQGVVIGAGSIVTKDIKAYEVVVGNPARKMTSRE